jgi:hypothetical protein
VRLVRVSLRRTFSQSCPPTRDHQNIFPSARITSSPPGAPRPAVASAQAQHDPTVVRNAPASKPGPLHQPY